ncbi:MAG: tetratricopeptide repeat protein [Myxococcales bacterium]|nr:tetratricopeptide repeat protein [Myxococcales bacterium]
MSLSKAKLCLGSTLKYLIVGLCVGAGATGIPAEGLFSPTQALTIEDSEVPEQVPARPLIPTLEVLRQPEGPPKRAMEPRGWGGEPASKVPTELGQPTRGSESAELFAEALRAQSVRDYTKAANIYERILKSYPKSAEAEASLISLGRLYDEVLNDDERALELFGTYVATYSEGNNLGLAKRRVESLRRAERGQGTERSSAAALCASPADGTVCFLPEQADTAAEQ